MEEYPLVSIITITRNRGKLLGRCIQSVLSQTYKNIEHIVVDGASDDETDAVISGFKDERLNFIKLKINIPIIDTINLGFEKSKGKYITFLDSDDEYLPEKIEKQLQLIETLPSNYGMVYCWMSYFDNATNEFLKLHKAELRGFVASEVVEIPAVSGTPTYFFRRNVFEQLGGWKKNIGIISDWELGARCCQKWKVDYVPESLINVYVNHNELRMSDVGYYKGFIEKQVRFEEYFLSEFSNIFKQYPKKSIPHLYVLNNCLFKLKQWRKALPYYKNLLKHDFSVKNLVLPMYCLFKKVK